MKIIALNGSPKGENGNTEVLLKNFIIGCKNAGADVETIYLKDKNIKHCCGCFTCWEKKPGKCIYKDDMESLLIKISKADIIIYATPLYYFTVTGIMKDFMDRMLPLHSGEIIKENDIYTHPKQNKYASSAKTILISNCGFPGRYNFSGLLETFNVISKGNLMAKILCTQGGILKISETNKHLNNLYKPFFNALIKAGEDVVTKGYITETIQKILDKPVMDTETYVSQANNRLK